MGAALGAGLILPAAAAQAAAAPTGRPDFDKPGDLPPGGQSDSRFPVSFATPVKEGLRLVMDYFTAQNQRDLGAIAKTLHFPFAIYEQIEPVVFQTEADFLKNRPESLNSTGRGRTRIGSDTLFVEAAMRWLRPGGRLVTVLPYGVLSNPRDAPLRGAVRIASIS